MGVIAEGILRGYQGLFTPVSLGYPLSVFNKNSTLQEIGSVAGPNLVKSFIICRVSGTSLRCTCLFLSAAYLCLQTQTSVQTHAYTHAQYVSSFALGFRRESLHRADQSPPCKTTHSSANLSENSPDPRR